MSTMLNSCFFASNWDDVLSQLPPNLECSYCEDFELENYDDFKKHINAVHFRFSLFCEIDGKPAYVLSCRRNCIMRTSVSEVNRSHFHCPLCQKIFGRKASFKLHLMSKTGQCGLLTNMDVTEQDRYSKYTAGYDSGEEVELSNDENDNKALTEALAAENLKSETTVVIAHDDLSVEKDHMRRVVVSPTVRLPKAIKTPICYPRKSQLWKDRAKKRPYQETAMQNTFNALAKAWKKEPILTSDEVQEEADRQFLLSFLPQLKKCDERQKSRFRSQMCIFMEGMLHGDEDYGS